MMQNAILYPKQPICKLRNDDEDVGIVVKYVGAQKSATVTVSSAGDITFKHGALGAEAVDATIDSGGNDAGVIDVSDANANTFGEVVDLINASPNWECFLVGALRADSSNASTGSLLEMTEATLLPNSDKNLYKDTSKVLNIGVRIGKRSAVSGTEERSASEIYQIISTNTFASGTNKIYIYEIDEAKKTETLLYIKNGGATTVENTQSFVVNGRGSIATSNTGKHLLVKMVGSAACTGNLMVAGATAAGL